MIDFAKKDIIGVHVNAVGYDDAVARIIHAARRRMALGVSALAVHGLMEGAFDPEHRYRLNSLHLVVPDGTGILWGLNLLHKTRLAERVRGPGLMLRTCSAAAEHGLPIFLFGSTRVILDKLCDSLLRRFPAPRNCRRRAFPVQANQRPGGSPTGRPHRIERCRRPFRRPGVPPPGGVGVRAPGGLADADAGRRCGVRHARRCHRRGPRVDPEFYNRTSRRHTPPPAGADDRCAVDRQSAP